MSTTSKWIIGMSLLAIVLSVALLGDLNDGSAKAVAAAATKPRKSSPALKTRLASAGQALQRAAAQTGPSKALLPRQWRHLPDDEANRNLVDLWLFTTKMTDEGNRSARLDALTMSMRSRGASVIPAIKDALDEVEPYNQEDRKALLYGLGEIAGELTWNSDQQNPEAIGQIIDIVESELGGPEEVAVGEFLSDWPQEALASMMHHDGRFSERDGEIYLETIHAKMSAVDVYRKLGDDRAMDRLRDIAQDESLSPSVRDMAKVSLAALSF